MEEIPKGLIKKIPEKAREQGKSGILAQILKESLQDCLKEFRQIFFLFHIPLQEESLKESYQKSPLIVF